jgi:hypothetical protein
MALYLYVDVAERDTLNIEPYQFPRDEKCCKEAVAAARLLVCFRKVWNTVYRVFARWCDWLLAKAATWGHEVSHSASRLTTLLFARKAG